MAIDPVTALALVSGAGRLGSGLLGARSAGKARKQNVQRINVANLINTLSPRAGFQPALQERNVGGLETFLEGLSQAAGIGQGVLGARQASQLRGAQVAGIKGRDEAVREALQRETGDIAAQGREGVLRLPETTVTAAAPERDFELGELAGFGAERRAIRESETGLDIAERGVAAREVSSQAKFFEVMQERQRTENLARIVSRNPGAFEQVGERDKSDVMLSLAAGDPAAFQQVIGKQLSPVDLRQLTESKVALDALNSYEQRFTAGGPEGLDIIGPVESLTNIPTGSDAAEVAQLELLQKDLAQTIRAMRESGVMTDEDFNRNMQLLPDPSGFFEREVGKFETLRGRLRSSVETRIRSFSGQRFNVQGLSLDEGEAGAFSLPDDQLEQIVRRAEGGDVRAKMLLFGLGIGQ